MSTTYLDRSNTHILIIDDDDRIRELLSRYLTKHGYRTSTASGADEARQKMLGLKYDLLIVDIMMPGEDGLSLTRSLRDYHDVPIILLTALGEADQRIAGLRSGADDYMSKPFEPEELLLRIDNIFRRTGKTPTADKVIFGPYAFDMTKGILRKNGKQMKLTTGEQTLLTLLAGQSGGVVSRYILSENINCLLYTSPSPRDRTRSRMPSSA